MMEQPSAPSPSAPEGAPPLSSSPPRTDVGSAPVLLAARGVAKRVKDGDRSITLLQNISLSVAAGERVALLGPSGSGKSTLLNILGALDHEFEGDVEVAGVHLRKMSDAQLAHFRNRTLGFVFQAYNLLGHLPALDNVLLPARFSDSRPDYGRARDVLARVGLADKANRSPATLSGGERQRVAIARALYSHPKLVLCDEPTGNLDRATGREILSLFEQLTNDGVALLVATHDEAIAAASHRVLRLAQGVLV